MSSTNPRAVFQSKDFRHYITARFVVICAYQMLGVAIAQYVYELTHNPLHLGYIGLALFIPRFTLALFAGHAADRYDRRTVILISRSVSFVAAVLLIGLIHSGHVSLLLIYFLLFFMGAANAFDGPANQAIVPQLVPPEHFSRAVAWSASSMQLAFIIGPAVGGFVYAASGSALVVFYGVAILRLVSVILVSFIKPHEVKREAEAMSLKTLFAGLRYVFENRIILGAISLDLFAVLLGGAVALLPIYANEILDVGAWGLGILRAMPSLGAALMAITLAHLPPMKKAGKSMFWAVGVFGLATIIFGLSKNFWLTLGCLFVLGAADMISVVIRGILVQLKTPEEMRGRVSAVNLVFIGASNELGEFESGITAAWFGVIPAVLIGGFGTLAVVGMWAWKFPELRKYERLE